MGIRSKRRLFWKKGIGDQAREEIAQEIDRASVPGVLELAQILELIDDGLNYRTLLKQDTIHNRHQLIDQMLLNPGDQLQPALEQRLEQLAGNIPPLAEELAHDMLGQPLHERQVAVIDVLPRWAMPRNVLWLWMRRLWQTFAASVCF